MMLRFLQITTDVTLVVTDGILIEAHKLILRPMNTFSSAFCAMHYEELSKGKVRATFEVFI